MSTLSFDEDQDRERQRLAALGAYDILDTPPEEAFDRITRLAGRLFEAPMAAVAFLDGRRQWFKSRTGLTMGEAERATNFCSVAIGQTGALVVPDATRDQRFRDHGFVIGPPHVRAYAGVPLRTGGLGVGTLCVMDTQARTFSPLEVATLTDLAGLVMTVLDLRLHATTDSLTGVRSRRAFRIAAERLVAAAARRGQDLACIMVDIDHFKRINDTHGHAVGDRVLKAFVAECRAGLRGSDVIGRMGGEEFAIVLPQTDEARALQLAERLRSRIEALEVPVPGGTARISASFGIAPLDVWADRLGWPDRLGRADRADRLDPLLARADAALYEAKREGRNRCRIWQRAAPIGASDGMLLRVA